MSDEQQAAALDLDTHERYFVFKVYNPEQCELEGFNQEKRKTKDGELTEWAVKVDFGPQKGTDATDLVTLPQIEDLVAKTMCINPKAEMLERKYGLLYFDKENTRKPVQGLYKNDFYRKIGPQISGLRQYRDLAAGGRVEIPNKAEVINPGPKDGVVTKLLNKTELRRYPPNCADVVSIV